MVAEPLALSRIVKVIQLHKSQYNVGEEMKHTFHQAVELFYKRVPEDYTRIPIKEHSDLRMGGWIIRDADNMVIGWVGHRGDVSVYNYEDRPLKRYTE